MTKIYNSGNILETNQILVALEQNHIAAHGKEVGANSYMKITGGMSVTGTDIYVAEEDAEAAREIIESITGIADSGDSGDEELEKLHRYDWKRRLFAIIMLLLILASIVAGMFFV